MSSKNAGQYAPLPPARFVETVSANTRSFYVSERFKSEIFINEIIYSFAANTQRTLRLRFWVSDQQAVDDDATPRGINLLAHTGTRDYVVGDGESNQRISINRKVPAGMRLMIDAENTDSYSHTVDAGFDAAEVL